MNKDKIKQTINAVNSKAKKTRTAWSVKSNAIIEKHGLVMGHMLAGALGLPVLYTIGMVQLMFIGLGIALLGLFISLTIIGILLGIVLIIIGLIIAVVALAIWFYGILVMIPLGAIIGLISGTIIKSRSQKFKIVASI